MSEEHTDLSHEAKAKVDRFLEKEMGSQRKLTGFWNWLALSLSFGMVFYYLWSAGITPMGPQFHRGIYVLVTFLLVFIFFPFNGMSRKPKDSILLDSVLIALSFGLILFWISQLFGLEVITAKKDMGYIVDYLAGTLFILYFLTFTMVTLHRTNRSIAWPGFVKPILLITSIGIGIYWIAQFSGFIEAGEILYKDYDNHEIDVFGMMMPLGALQKVLGWMGTLSGVFLLVYIFARPYFPPRKESTGYLKPVLSDIIFLIGVVLSVTYYITQLADLNSRAGAENDMDYLIGVIGVLVSLEVARRVLGWSLAFISILFLLYDYFAPYIPEYLNLTMFDLIVATLITSIIGMMKYKKLDSKKIKQMAWLLAFFFVIYAFFRSSLVEVVVWSFNSGAFQLSGFSEPIKEMAIKLFIATDGVFGVMAYVMATHVILFIFFGAFLKQYGVTQFFINFALSVAGKAVGGPAKVAVIASAFFGSISGSAIANTVSTGIFTIPMMKKAGFRPHVAGAIEPSASIAGMFLPPVMGAGGFLMSELTEIPYLTIMLLAIFPAFLYILGVYSMIHFEAKKHNIQGMEEDIPSVKELLRKEWYMLMPLVIVVWMMIRGYSPGHSAFWGVVITLLIGFVQKGIQSGNPYVSRSMVIIPVKISTDLILYVARKISPLPASIEWFYDLHAGYTIAVTSAACILVYILYKCTWSKLISNVVNLFKDLIDLLKDSWKAMINGANQTLIIGATVGAIGIIVGSITMTGVGLKFSVILKDLAGGDLLLTVIMIALASLILGMGVPVTAAYMITVGLMAPALHELGVAIIAAHMIVYWFSQDSNITPPVCIAAYAGAAIAGADPWKTGWTAFKYAKMLYVVPLLFAFVPGILPRDLIGGTPVNEWTITPVILKDALFIFSDTFLSYMPTFLSDLVSMSPSLLDILPKGLHKVFYVVLVFGSAIFGTIAFSALTMFYLARRTTWIEWLLLLPVTFLLFWPSLTTTIIGGLLFYALYTWQKKTPLIRPV